MKKMISEILEECSKIKTKPNRIKFLQDNNSQALKDVLRFNFDDRIQTLLPEGTPPTLVFDTAPAGYNFSNLEKESINFAFWVKGGKKMSQMKREDNFLKSMTRLNQKEAELMIAAKDKNLKYKGISKAMIKEAFPNWGIV